jgi:hypothetical protein
MEQLGERLLREQLVRLDGAVRDKVRDDGLPNEDITGLVERLGALGLVKVGRLRARWFVQGRPYCPEEAGTLGLIADLLLALAMMARVSRSRIRPASSARAPDAELGSISGTVTVLGTAWAAAIPHVAATSKPDATPNDARVVRTFLFIPLTSQD